MIFILYFLLISFTKPQDLPADKGCSIIVEITNLKSTQADVLVGVFEKNGFPRRDSVKYNAVKTPNAKTITVEVPNIPPGEYAVTAFQDMNGDLYLNKTIFGAPKEPFGFSHNPTIRFSEPAFEECAFKI